MIAEASRQAILDHNCANIMRMNALCLYVVARAARANCVAFLPQFFAHHDVLVLVGAPPLARDTQIVNKALSDCEHPLDS